MYIDVIIGSPYRSPASVTMGPVSRWSGDTETRSAVTQRTDRVMLLQPPGSDFYMLPAATHPKDLTRTRFMLIAIAPFTTSYQTTI